ADPNQAADGFLINGSVNNGAASPFAQPAAFGNNRRRPGALYTWALGLLAGHSALDARPYSFTAERAAKPDYSNLHALGTFQGLLPIPWPLRNRPNLFVGFQRTDDTNSTTASARMPTALERAGDFSETRDRFGRPVQIVDPVTGAPFPENRIPRDRVSPQAAALLAYYPLPNVEGDGRFNYQVPLVNDTRQEHFQSRVLQSIDGRNQLQGAVAYQRTTTDTRSLFGFEDAARNASLDASAIWTRRLSFFSTLRLQYQFTRVTNETMPYFAHRTHVSAEAGITGNDQDPVNWGPPSLQFATIAGLTDASHRFDQTRTSTAAAELFLSRGRHNMTLGGELRRHDSRIRSQENARGTWSFTGAATGHDLADFLLGLPRTSAIAYGNPDKDFRGPSYALYFTDDYRVGPGLTLNLGVRWEFEAPLEERLGRLVNLDVAPGFAAAAPVLAADPVGSLTGTRYPSSLVRPDWTGLQPRLAMAWRPLPGSSLVVRAGYGIYRNTNVYLPIATQLAQQPPLSTTYSIEATPSAPLSMAKGFAALPRAVTNTFAVDPDFRVGYAHNWQVSAQRDLPASLTVIASYLGSKGSRLMQQFLPNTYPIGAVNPCPACPSGFRYLTSNGRSIRHAGQVQLRRRLRNGLTASVQYTLADARDDASAFSGLNVTAVAQDWRDPAADWAPSSFDQRHKVEVQFQYTTGVGVAGGTLLDGLRGALFKGWTITSQLTAGSGLPLTPVYFAPVPGTGFVGTLRPMLTGASTTPAAGSYLNPAAYAVPPPGQWGNAGRNSVRGPAQFAVNAGVSRTFPWGDRLNLEWRVDATNVFNQVTYATVDTVVGSPQFGLPTLANPMRKLQTTIRLRF
ncbi:MAG TPA: hypothetical protein VNI78_01405, partial [Vicinamibacterales bacterium]|nr:hypothetical protein [Vicinamibacterales bacterium]